MSNSLNSELIVAAIEHPAKNILSLTVLDHIDSTNNYLMKLSVGRSSGQACIADWQTAGRGRNENLWYSPPDTNIYISLMWEFLADDNLTALSLMTALSLVKCMRKAGFIDAGIKWPNDIYLGDKKVCGVLIDIICKKKVNTIAVIGVGLNLKQQKFPKQVNQPATYLESVIDNIDRNETAAMVFESLLGMLDQSPEVWSRELLKDWNKYDIAYNQMVEVTRKGVKTIGVAVGINESLQLCLRIEKQLVCFDDIDSSMKLLSWNYENNSG